MVEIISMQNAENIDCFDKFIGYRDSGETMNGDAGKARKCDSRFLARGGGRCSLLKLEPMMFAFPGNIGERGELKVPRQWQKGCLRPCSARRSELLTDYYRDTL